MLTTHTNQDRQHGPNFQTDIGFWYSLAVRLAFLAALLSVVSYAGKALSADLTESLAEPPQSDRADQVAFLPLGLNLDTRVRCGPDAISFSLQNQGEDWPSRANIAISNDMNGQVLTQRSLNMKQGQNVTFRFKTGGRPVGNLGLDIEADWVSPTKLRQITVNCDRRFF